MTAATMAELWGVLKVVRWVVWKVQSTVATKAVSLAGVLVVPTAECSVELTAVSSVAL